MDYKDFVKEGSSIGQMLKLQSNNCRTQRLNLEKTLKLLANRSQTLTWLVVK